MLSGMKRDSEETLNGFEKIPIYGSFVANSWRLGVNNRYKSQYKPDIPAPETGIYVCDTCGDADRVLTEVLSEEAKTSGLTADQRTTVLDALNLARPVSVSHCHVFKDSPLPSCPRHGNATVWSRIEPVGFDAFWEVYYQSRKRQMVQNSIILFAILNWPLIIWA